MHLHISRGRATHVLEACLNSDGTRSYKIDSRNKTATQVKVCRTCRLQFSPLSCQQAALRHALRHAFPAHPDATH